eukprot:scaffold4463_cov51-Attheya_sp.AAC.15
MTEQDVGASAHELPFSGHLSSILLAVLVSAVLNCEPTLLTSEKVKSRRSTTSKGWENKIMGAPYLEREKSYRYSIPPVISLQ